MKGLATAAIVIIILSVLTMGVIGYMFSSGYNPGKKQISRQKLISTCQKLCTEDQEKIYQLKGHPGVLDLPNKKGGLMFLKPTSFCSNKYQIQNKQVYCDQITTCKVTDGDGDTEYLHCENNYHSVGGGGGGGGGSSINVNGPLALGVPIGEKLTSCDKPGNYIKFYVTTNKPLIGSKLKVWGIVCKDGGPVANQKVMISWDKIPLSKILYTQGFDNITEDNTHNLQVLKGWYLNDSFFRWRFGNDWFWNNIGDSGVIRSLGFLSPYCCGIYKHGGAYPNPDMDFNYFNVPLYAQKADEVDMRIGASQGPRFYHKNGERYLTLGGVASEVIFELSNGTNTTFNHYIAKYSGCHPGLVWNCFLTDYQKYWKHYPDDQEYVNVTNENCSNLLNYSYNKIGIFKNLNWKNKFTYRNVSIPGNNSNNIFLIKYIRYYGDPMRFKLIKPNKNYTLKRVYFAQYYIGVGGCGGVGVSIEDFKIRKYVNITKTNKFGMFNTTISVPMKSGLHNLSAKGIGTNIMGSLDVTAIPYIKVNFDTSTNNENLTVFGDIKYLNGTGVNNSALWILLDGVPYPDQKIITKYDFDSGSVPKEFKAYKGGPSSKHIFKIQNGYLNVTSHNWYSGTLLFYYIFDNPQFIQNVSYDVNLITPFNNGPSSSSNYTYYINTIYEISMNTMGHTPSYYLSENGTNLYRKWWVTQSLTGTNLSLDTWHHIWYSPLEWIGNTENGEKRNLGLEFHGCTSTQHNMTMLIDNLTITSIGKTYADQNGHFVINIPKNKLSSGSHKVTILAYDKFGAQAIKSKTI